MSEILPTVKVKHKKYGIEMIVNESDFNSEIHEPLCEKSKKIVSEMKKAEKGNKGKKETIEGGETEEDAKKKAEEEEAAKLQALMGGK